MKKVTIRQHKSARLSMYSSFSYWVILAPKWADTKTGDPHQIGSPVVFLNERAVIKNG